MIEKTVKLINKLGLHARASMKLCDTASKFEAETTLCFNGNTVNAKSIMGLLVLGASCNSELTLTAEGSDEDAAIEALETLINDRFGETE